eukprot:12650104-Heterocapsa_arctica.AAC.1
MIVARRAPGPRAAAAGPIRLAALRHSGTVVLAQQLRGRLDVEQSPGSGALRSLPAVPGRLR